MDIDLNPDGPHSPERTREVANLFDAASRFLTYATMPGKLITPGLQYPADAYSLLGEYYSVTGRFRQDFDQLKQFLAAQYATGCLYEAQGRDIAVQVAKAIRHLDRAADAAQALTVALQAVQADIAGLGVKEDDDG